MKRIRTSILTVIVMIFILLMACECKIGDADWFAEPTFKVELATITGTATTIVTAENAQQSIDEVVSNSSTDPSSPETEGTCMELLEPADGSELQQIGEVSFEWGTVDGAVSYIIEFTSPTGKTVSFNTQETSHSRFCESLPWGGEFNWRVIALDEDGQEICASQSFAFTKEEPPVPDTATPEPADDDEERPSDGGSSGPGPTFP